MADPRRKVVRTNRAPAAIGPYSQAIIAGNLVFVAGQGGKDPKTGEMKQGIAAQTKQAIANIKAVLAAAGTSLDSVAKVTVYISDMKNFEKMNEAYSSFFARDQPARATVEVGLPKGWFVEIEAVALLPSR